MTSKIKPFGFSSHEGDVGHSVVFGPTRTGMSVMALFKELASGHPGGKASLTQAGNHAPYYRRFEKRK
ncbi:hypothetical protein [Paraburkholderia largidicola]|uniref:Uncharacterized protein n=1 Tax=Paraburkholderia largidicola TaxID=3014751 RepID=A0A7I8C6H9_9BURK|nr:hypothetical protein [Paraburkholderia sp. PGU16]BCF95380.1 hypothetical protein PPGU16_84470 [Paraburkholderia sp. PGU16]